MMQACLTFNESSQLTFTVEARQEIDLRLGAAFTRFQTLRMQNKFAQVAQGMT